MKKYRITVKIPAPVTRQDTAAFLLFFSRLTCKLPDAYMEIAKSKPNIVFL